MDRITDQPHDEPAPRRRTATRGLLAAGAAVVALGIGAVGASAGSGSGAAATDAPAGSGSMLVQESTPQQPADPAPRGDKPPCPEGEDRGSQGSGGAEQTPDASDAALS